MNRRLSLSCVALSMVAGSASCDCVVRKIADLPVTMMGHQPLVSASINGTKARFLADSGAFYSLISPSKAAELDLKPYPAPFNITVVGAGGEAQAQVVRVKTFAIAGGNLTDIEFLVTGNALGQEIAGVVGQNILGMADVEYDLANGVISLWTSRGCGNREFTYWRAKDQTYGMLDIEALDATQHRTVGAAYVNGVKLRALFATGAGMSMITIAAARRAGIDIADPRVVSAGVIGGGVGVKRLTEYIAPVGSFKVGGEEIRNTHLRVGDADLFGNDMLIGADFFLSHRIFVSNTQHRIYFTYNGGPVFNVSSGIAAPPQVDDAKTSALPRPRDDADTLARRGAAESARLNWTAAIADLTRARTAAPGDADFAYQRAVVYVGDHQPTLAIADLNDAIKLEPGDTLALILRAQLNLAAGDKARALADIDAADRVAAKQADSRLTLAKLYYAAAAYRAAITQYDLWLASHPDDADRPTGLNGRCWTGAVLGQDLSKALADCDSALKLSPGSSHVLDSRGLVHLRLGQFDKAIADYDAALAINPKIAWSLYGRGIARSRLGLTAESKSDIAAAVALEPKLPAIAKGYGVTP